MKLLLLSLLGTCHAADRVTSVTHDSKRHTVTITIEVDSKLAEQKFKKPEEIVKEVLPAAHIAMYTYQDNVGRTEQQVDAEVAAKKAELDAQAERSKAALVTIK